MKKIISLVLMVVMLFSVSAFAEEEVFTLHNGTTFGMTMEEVIELEANGGFALEKEKEPLKAGNDILRGIGTIANQKDSKIGYCFLDNQLYEMYYEFVTTETSYNAIENSLVEKYGDTEFSSKTGFTFPPTKRDTMVGHPNLPTSNVEYMPLFSQRIITIENGNEMLIDHYCNSIKHVLIYTILTPEEASILKNDVAPSDDL